VRPLDRLPSIKLKLSVVIVSAVVVTVVVVTFGSTIGLTAWVVVPAATVLSLALIHVLARGMTAPLRGMVRQATRLAAGETHEHVTATSRDEVGELARAFNHMADELAASDRMRRDLVANVSHELRTPISALHGVLENVLDGVQEPDPDVLEGLLAQVARLKNLVAQLLDLSRLEAGVIVLDCRTVVLRGLIADAVAAATLGRDGKKIEVDVDPALTIRGDGDRLIEMLTNLLGNALRHGPPGAPVEVTADAAAGGVVIAVTDRGPGIPDGEAERVFDRFYRTDLGRASTDGGSGLGLAIARWVVDLHGGSIRVDGGYPDGCRMLVTLPAA
jgi:signal transduction histidine kinase